MENIYKRTTITNSILSSVAIRTSRVSKLGPHVSKKAALFQTLQTQHTLTYTNTYPPTLVWQDCIADSGTSCVKGVLLIKI